jgi:adenylylsulfate kinase
MLGAMTAPLPERARRAELLGQRGATLWLTGLSGSGKTTIARATERALLELGRLVYRLDGDEVRTGLCRDLGFSPDDRAENIRRVGEVARLLADAGAIVLASFISPYAAGRDAARAAHVAADLPFLEAFVDCPLSVAEARDPKGLYARARAGQLRSFTGVDAPYEVPNAPEIHLRTDRQSVEDEAAVLVEALRRCGAV